MSHSPSFRRSCLRAVISLVSVAATFTGVATVANAAETTQAIQRTDENNIYRVVGYNNQTFKVQTVLQFNNNGTDAVKPANVSLDVQPPQGIAVESVTFSSDGITPAEQRLLTDGKHVGVAEGSKYSAPADSIKTVQPGGKWATVAEITYKVTDVTAATQKNQRWCADDSHGLKMAGNINGQAVSYSGYQGCTSLRYPAFEVQRSVNNEDADQVSSAAIVAKDTQSQSSFTITNRGSADLSSFAILDNNMDVRDNKFTVNGSTKFHDLTCTSEGLEPVATLESDGRVAKISFGTGKVLAPNKSVTCTSSIPFADLSFDRELDARRLVVKGAPVNAGQTIETELHLERIEDTYLKSPELATFTAELKQRSTTPRVLDGSNGQKVAVEYVLNVRNLAVSQAATPKQVVIDTSKILPGLNVESVSLDGAPVTNADQRLVTGKQQLTKQTDGTWAISSGLNQINANGVDSAVVRVVASVASTPAADVLKCTDAAGHGLRVGASVDGSTASEQCVDAANTAVKVSRVVSKDAQHSEVFVTNSPDTPVRLPADGKAYFGVRVTNDGSAKLKSVYVRDTQRGAAGGELDQNIGYVDPSGLTCDNGATATVDSSKHSYEITFANDGLAKGAQVSCFYTNGVTPAWQGNDYTTQSAVSALPVYNTDQLEGATSITAPTSQSKLYIRKQGVATVSVDKVGTLSTAPVATNQDQKLTVPFYVQLRNNDFSTEQRPGFDIPLGVVVQPGMAVDKITVSPATQDSLVSETFELVRGDNGYSIPANKLNALPRNSVRVAHVDVTYRVGNFTQLKDAKATHTCADGNVSSGLRLSSDGKTACQSITYTDVAAKATINGQTSVTLADQSPVTMAYSFTNTGTAALSKIGFADQQLAMVDGKEQLGSIFNLQGLTCDRGTVTQGYDTNNGKTSYRSAVLDLSSAKLEAGQTVTCTQKVPFDQLWFYGKAHGGRLTANAGAPFPNSQVSRGGTTPTAVNSAPVNSWAYKPGTTDPGNGGTTDPGNGGTTDPGNGGTTDPGNGGTTDPGNGGTTDPGNGGTTDPGNGGTTDPGNGGTTDPGNGGTTDPGNGGTTDPGNGGTTDPGNGGTTDPGNGGTTDPGNGGTTDPGNGGTTDPGNGGTTDPGNGGTTDPGNGGTTDPGNGGTTDPGNGGTTDPGNGGTTDPGNGGTTDPGNGGTTDPGNGGTTDPGNGGNTGGNNGGTTDPGNGGNTGGNNGGTTDPGTNGNATGSGASSNNGSSGPTWLLALPILAALIAGIFAMNPALQRNLFPVATFRIG